MEEKVQVTQFLTGKNDLLCQKILKKKEKDERKNLPQRTAREKKTYRKQTRRTGEKKPKQGEKKTLSSEGVKKYRDPLAPTIAGAAKQKDASLTTQHHKKVMR